MADKGRHRRGAVAAPIAATAVAGLLLAGCTAGDGTLRGRAPLGGGAPGNGQVCTVVAIRGGRVIDQAKVGPGERFDLPVPPGRYWVGLWQPGQPRVAWLIACAVQAAISSGQTVTVNLQKARSEPPSDTPRHRGSVNRQEPVRVGWAGTNMTRQHPTPSGREDQASPRALAVPAPGITLPGQQPLAMLSGVLL